MTTPRVVPDPPAPRGCGTILSAAVSAALIVAGALVRWGPGDAIAAAFWLVFFGTITWFAVDDARRHQRRIDQLVPPRQAEPRSHVRIIEREAHQ